jgi:hypothetical protein
VHRTFCLTYPHQTDLFLPLIEPAFVFDSGSATAYLVAELSKDFPLIKYEKMLPPSLIRDQSAASGMQIRSKDGVRIGSADVTSLVEIDALKSLQIALRPDLNYIAGSQTLWYAKLVIPGPRRLSRSPLTMTLAAMHRLSEICRYKPIQLASFLNGQENWLLTEFIRMSPLQFLDEIAAEITGFQFMSPNVRPAT